MATVAFRLTTTVAHSPPVVSILRRQSGPGRRSDLAIGAFLMRLIGPLVHLLHVSFRTSVAHRFLAHEWLPLEVCDWRYRVSGCPRHTSSSGRNS